MIQRSLTAALRATPEAFVVECPYDVSTELWQVSHETVVQLDELIDRLRAATRVSEEALAAEFPELRAAAAAG